MEETMKSNLMLGLMASGAITLLQTAPGAFAQGGSALTGLVTSEAEGAMEGVVVTARKAGAKFAISVTTDAQGRYTFPASKLEPGQYALTIRAVGYELGGKPTADVAAAKAATVDLKLATTNLSSVPTWQYELKTMPRPKGQATRAIVTEYDLARPTTEPHDIIVDA